jgi:hypothetical protein
MRIASKEQLHRLIDELPEHELHAAQRFLEYLRDIGSDSVLRALMEASEDDEPTTPDEDEGAADAWHEYLRGEARPWEEVRKN